MLDQEQFLPSEEILIKVRVVNHSGRTLTFGEDNEWLRISIQSAESLFVVRSTEGLPVEGVFELPPSKMGTKTLDIAPYFTLTEPGRYTIVATVVIKEWGQTLTSEPEMFDIVNGRKLWEQAFGMPNSSLSDGSPEVRKYLLQQANYVRSQLRLYARVTDASESHTFSVIPIGGMVSFSEPEARLDAKSNLHVLYASGPHNYTYCVISPQGTMLDRQAYGYTSSRPQLSAKDDGSIKVRGGVRATPPDKAQPVETIQNTEPDDG